MRFGHLSETQERVLAGIALLLAPAEPKLDERTQGCVSRYVNRFVSLQVENIPNYLRVPYLIAITAFQWLPVLRYGRRFLDLPIEAQRSYLALWSDGPLAPMRDFVRLIRGCALLAYFDHPDVRGALEAGRQERVQDGNGSRAAAMR